MTESSFTNLPIMLCILVSIAFILMLMMASSIRIVPEYKRLSVFRFGRYIGEKGPGLVILLPIIDKAIPIDTRDQVTKVQEQQKLWGAIGETLTPVYTEGSIEISGEIWNAISKTPIPLGAKVRVARVLLEIEKL